MTDETRCPHGLIGEEAIWCLECENEAARRRRDAVMLGPGLSRAARLKRPARPEEAAGLAVPAPPSSGGAPPLPREVGAAIDALIRDGAPWRHASLQIGALEVAIRAALARSEERERALRAGALEHIGAIERNLPLALTAPIAATAHIAGRLQKLRAALSQEPAAPVAAPPCGTLGPHSSSMRVDVNLDAWPIADVLERLADAADHLRQDHDCDALGHEGVLYAAQAARAHVKLLRAALSPAAPTPTPEPMRCHCGAHRAIAGNVAAWPAGHHAYFCDAEP